MEDPKPSERGLEVWKTHTPRGSRLERLGRFKTGHFGRMAAQIFQTISSGAIWGHFGAKVTQMLQMVSLGIHSYQFGPKASQML